MKVHAYRAWTILCLLWIRSLGGNLKERQAKEWLHAFLCTILKQYRYENEMPFSFRFSILYV